MAETRPTYEYAVSLRLRFLDYNVRGISFEDFARICCLPGQHEDVMLLIKTPLLQLCSDTVKLPRKMESVGDLLQTVINKLNRFTTLEHFVWLIRTTIGMQLLKIGSSRIIKLQTKLLVAIGNLDETTFKHTPDVIDIVAKSFEDLIRLTNSNPVCVLYRLWLANSNIFYYTAVAIIFAHIEKLLYPDKSSVKYRVQNLGDLLIYLLTFDLLHEQQKSVKVYELLSMLHMYQILVIVVQVNKSAQALEEEHGCYAEHFYMKQEYLVLFRKWLDAVATIVEQGNNQNEKELLNKHLIPVAEACNTNGAVTPTTIVQQKEEDLMEPVLSEFSI